MDGQHIDKKGSVVEWASLGYIQVDPPSVDFNSQGGGSWCSLSVIYLGGN